MMCIYIYIYIIPTIHTLYYNIWKSTVYKYLQHKYYNIDNTLLHIISVGLLIICNG